MSFKSGMKMTRDNLRRIMAVITDLPNHDVLVGYPQEDTERREDRGDKVRRKGGNTIGGIATDITNAELAYIHEFGAPEVNIPARPSLVPGIRDAKDKIEKYLKQAAVYAVDGNEAGMLRGLNAAGLAASSSVKRKITTGPFQELAERTLAARRRRGRTGEKPLVDTAQMRNAVTYIVKDNRGS